MLEGGREMLEGGREMLQGGREMLQGGRKNTKLQKKGLKGVKIEKSFLVPYTTHIGLPKSEKKVFQVYNHFKVSLKVYLSK